MKWLIYKHTNTINGKCYIGQTCKGNPNYRWNNGKGYTVRNPNSHFARAIKKYGWNAFEHEIIEDNIQTLEQANKREEYWISYFNSVENGYNANSGGNSKIPSKETREKNSIKSKEMWAQKGDELRKIYASKEHRETLSRSIKQSYIDNPELRKRISLSRSKKICITNGVETKTIDSSDFEYYKSHNWQRGSVFIRYELLAQMIEDFAGENDLSIHEISVKYGFDGNVVRRAFAELNIKIIKKPYRTWQKVKGVKRSESFKKKHSEMMKKQRKNHIWINKNGKSKSIIAEDERSYLSDGWSRGRGKINSVNMTHESTKKKIVCVETNTVFNSIVEAAKTLGISKNGIINVLKHRPHSKTAGGYHWQYAEENEESK